MPRVLAVLGPTASGKTAKAILFALRMGGEIVSCDSVQIYKYFNIGSAKPTTEELSTVPHHLVDILEPSQTCTAGFWRDQALSTVNDIVARGKIPIIAGGTGLYFKSLFLGLFEGVSTNADIRARLETEADNLGLNSLYTRLQALDPAYASKISVADRKRVIRALEAFEVTGEPFSQLHKKNIKPQWDWDITCLAPEKEILGERIKIRAQQMIELGLIEETQSLFKLYPSSPALNTIGYKEVCSYLKGEIANQQDLIDAIVLSTRRLAKHQNSLFRNLFKNMSNISWEEQ
ncbi:MAG: tRNA (adenosine(37)-N6)-dimethylallyltransferase MiaA [Brevinema sp.]